MVSIPAGLFTVREAGTLVSIGTLLAFVIVALGVLVLRVRHPELHRPFKTPAVFVIAPLAVVSSLYLMSSLPWPTWERLLIWLGIGLAIYFGYGYRHSALNRKSSAPAATTLGPR